MFKAADNWLNYNILERSKFAKELLFTVRLPLLSDHALKYIINKHSSFSKNEDCIPILKDVLDNKKSFVRKNSNFPLTHRFCSQKSSNILICGGFDTRSHKNVGEVKQISGSNLENVKTLSSMTKDISYSDAVCLRGEIYVFGGRDENGKQIMSIEKYSPLDNCWRKISDMHDCRSSFCVCSFTDKMYIFGGFNKGSLLASSLVFDPNCASIYKWKEVSRMNEARRFAACAVFEGKIIVSGGCNIYLRNELNTVESYDVIGNEWSPMANMINNIHHHSLVAVKNKLFVIGRATNTCEVYDSACKQFVALRSNPFINLGYIKKVIRIGSKIFAFRNDRSSSLAAVSCYDVKRNTWSTISFKVAENLVGYSIANIPSF